MNQPTSLPPEKLKDKNLAFFNQYFPEVYRLCTSRTFERLTLNIDHRGKIDLMDGKDSLYNGDAVTYSREEASHFLNMYQPGNLITTIAPPIRGDLSYHRFFSKRFNKLINSTPDHVSLTPNYKMPDFLPMIAFLGAGLGIHIGEVLNQKRVLNVLIFEPDNEKFMASLYITDWKDLLQPLINSGKSVKVMVGLKHNIEPEEIAAHLWNELITYTPSFPLTALFYNHMQDEVFLPVVAKIREDLHFFLNQWGFYDDEINQMNNALHNIFAGIPQLNSADNKLSGPIAIVGGGPSLDNRIESLRQHQDKLIIISCGTAVHTLLKEGIVPDIHVEIESHMLTYESLYNAENPELFEKTLLIGAVQLPPNVFQLFKNKAYFIKDSTALAELFTTPEEVIERATPTCTNSGLAIATHLKASEIYLFGMDFGFSSMQKHHSKSSIYYANKFSDEMQRQVDAVYSNIQQVESVSGEKILTIPMYSTSRRAIEFCIKAESQQYELSVRNCSDGAKVEYTQHTSDEEFLDLIRNKKEKLINFIPQSSEASEEKIRKRIEVGSNYIKKTCRELSIHTKTLNPASLESLFNTCHMISRHISGKHLKQYGSLYFLTRGSLWHFMNAGTSIALSIEDSEERTVFIQGWKESFEAYLKDLPDHFNKITSKHYPDPEDPWIQPDIVGNEHLFHE